MALTKLISVSISHDTINDYEDFKKHCYAMDVKVSTMIGILMARVVQAEKEDRVLNYKLPKRTNDD